jgi:hypothetical protein
MTIASKLTKSVRQAKESVANQHDETGSGAPDLQPDLASRQENKITANHAQEPERPKVSKKPESESPIVPFPYRRVWPD